ncbi:MAG: polyribonucleotide nucleotidyltransferase [Tenericutes bacterium GWC2_34_14]|nr:MAG: polyribonucleotide nucleotidyltransferase [Tenericutes bacterium GWC2_34_14]OHE34620.1 MAG: polyribonucleotide nucleotidyltransferase [Tenericutes bacterium GWE2_34_108]OHE35977.1 MAG: polyribonucleotide nucleotidyltransferase [Tenericutes bacterium GWF1_35_14]OHE38937.1 MAG: polyribonucleotide nucleotidyltransferase [Tenericutes bacterium GWF2_35_184]OHE42589.1 MAG: polyribonucleotide nucleotidyltransferase [Tenericutes bacterium RIFOXYA12_FULL_35_10]OHE42996.1 MAG: polyribonucleotide
MMQKKIYETTLGGRVLRVEIGEVAKQAAGSAMITYGDSTVLSVVTAKNEASTQDFFPLMVLYQEKLYAAGKIPGGFLRREGRPSEHETLTSRLIDRPLRPLFPEGFKNEVQIVNTVLSSDPDNTTEIASLIGSSIVLGISNIPFNGPVAGVQIGRLNGEIIINPTVEQQALSDIELTVAGTKDAINMVEAGAKQVSEEDMLHAIMVGHAEIKKLVEFIQTILDDNPVEKMDFEAKAIDPELKKQVDAYVKERMVKAVSIFDKLERYQAIDDLTNETVDHFSKTSFIKEIEGIKFFDEQAQKDYLGQVKTIVDGIVTQELRRLITQDKVRPDGRKVDEIRPLSSRVDILPRTHGSSLFTRGQTQALGVVTLGALGENQIIDGLGLEDTKRFMLHYNFPPFSVGETGRYGGPGRREIGHGALGERALLQVLPNEEEFPYTIRVVSEILESNGSSSQATICAGTMALMAAGVPIKAPVAGIAMGLIKEGEYYAVLSDIQGMEDHEGDMDFKVAGTKDGITALQMDIKISGITEEILREALEQARIGRLHILDHMLETIPAVRSDLSKYAPKVMMIRINPDKIRDVIGAGGKIISQIIEDNNQVKIDIEQDGRVFLMHTESKWIQSAADRILALVKEAKVGEIYEGKVTRVEKFGCFVELWPGAEGLVHISRLAKERVEKVEDVVSLGDIILVKCIGIDEKGRIDLSRKDALVNK